MIVEISARKMGKNRRQQASNHTCRVRLSPNTGKWLHRWGEQWIMLVTLVWQKPMSIHQLSNCASISPSHNAPRGARLLFILVYASGDIRRAILFKDLARTARLCPFLSSSLSMAALSSLIFFPGTPCGLSQDAAAPRPP
jgi:hypothetical protein